MLIGLVLGDRKCREALHNVLRAFDYDCITVGHESVIQELAACDNIDAWVFDAGHDELFDILAKSDKYLLPADNLPVPGVDPHFDTWCEGLLRQLDSALKKPAYEQAGASWSDVSSVWILGASTGGGPALRTFLAGIGNGHNAAFIIGQHTRLGDHFHLSDLQNANPALNVSFARGVKQLRPNDVLIAPPHAQLEFGLAGRVTLSNAAYSGGYTPNINQMIYKWLDADLPGKGVIIFSGMDDDGAQGCVKAAESGIPVFAQLPESSICDSMPSAVIDNGSAVFVGTPLNLASSFLDRANRGR
ncbi:hypothetical protein A3709_20555 [Halioglobus sp. HI00S01]|uniref:chemotaxis protein CheB n=1 Tax=Halioglobus sp. HI00S01 TaxID=1822214 RepID=UPI0007C37AB3|nr:chemotaxis protein CheB [Halioglobus sp. HI00S01]KZX58005.1 hypothetical protein A3709_20555 [Halioglobus sp. HI00S01]